MHWILHKVKFFYHKKSPSSCETGIFILSSELSFRRSFRQAQCPILNDCRNINTTFLNTFRKKHQTSSCNEYYKSESSFLYANSLLLNLQHLLSCHKQDQ